MGSSGQRKRQRQRRDGGRGEADVGAGGTRTAAPASGDRGAAAKAAGKGASRGAGYWKCLGVKGNDCGYMVPRGQLWCDACGNHPPAHVTAPRPRGEGGAGAGGGGGKGLPRGGGGNGGKGGVAPVPPCPTTRTAGPAAGGKTGGKGAAGKGNGAGKGGGGKGLGGDGKNGAPATEREAELQRKLDAANAKLAKRADGEPAGAPVVFDSGGDDHGEPFLDPEAAALEKVMEDKRARFKVVVDTLQKVASQRKNYIGTVPKVDDGDGDEDQGIDPDEVIAAFDSRLQKLRDEQVELRADIDSHKPMRKQVAEAKSARGKTKGQLEAAEARLQSFHDAQRAAAAGILREEGVVAQLEHTLELADAKVASLEGDMLAAEGAEGEQAGAEGEPEKQALDAEGERAFDDWFDLAGGQLMENMPDMPDCFKAQMLQRIKQSRRPGPPTAPRAAPATAAELSWEAPDPAARAAGMGPTPLRVSSKARGAPPAARAPAAVAAAPANAPANEAPGAPEPKRKRAPGTEPSDGDVDIDIAEVEVGGNAGA